MKSHYVTFTQRWIRGLLSVALAVLLAATVAADPFELEWRTVDGGGQMFSTGGAYSLGGTIGQHDASSFSSPMSGGAYSLVGGFWPGAVTATCGCPGNTNGDSVKDGRDIQKFVACVLATGPGCACADVDGVPGVSLGDVGVFVADLIAGTACP